MTRLKAKAAFLGGFFSFFTIAKIIKNAKMPSVEKTKTFFSLVSVSLAIKPNKPPFLATGGITEPVGGLMSG